MKAQFLNDEPVIFFNTTSESAKKAAETRKEEQGGSYADTRDLAANTTDDALEKSKAARDRPSASAHAVARNANQNAYEIHLKAAQLAEKGGDKAMAEAHRNMARTHLASAIAHGDQTTGKAIDEAHEAEYKEAKKEGAVS
jgi:hypothetical protein